MSRSARRASEFSEAAWARFGRCFAGTVVVLGIAAFGFVAGLDPYGLRAAPGRPQGPLMDSNQRFLYPQIVRSGLYDAAVFGNSTGRLLDPRDLDRAFGDRFANLAISAATPYEQSELARLFLRHVKARAMIFTLDITWCESDADKRKLTYRAFPSWLYDDARNGAVLRQMNWRTVTNAAYVLLHRFGLMQERIRGDGFAVFTPPEERYDARRAAAAIHAHDPVVSDAEGPEVRPASSAIFEGPIPALGWLDDLLARTPDDAVKIVALMPVHVSVQGKPGSRQADRERECKEGLARIGIQRGATVVDFRIPSPVTEEDTNYWDPLHYRLPIGRRIVDGLKDVQSGGGDDPDGFYRVLARP